METFAASLAICGGSSLVTGGFPTQRPVTWNFDIFFDLCLNERLSKQSWGWWFQMPSWPLWRHSDVDEIFIIGCTASCHFDNFQWWKVHQYDDISISVRNSYANISKPECCIFSSFCLYLCCDLWLSSRQWTAVIEQSMLSLLLMACRHKWYVFTSAEGWLSIMDIFNISLVDLGQKQYGNVSMV